MLIGRATAQTTTPDTGPQQDDAQSFQLHPSFVSLLLLPVAFRERDTQRGGGGERKRKRERQRDRQADRNKDGQTDTHC